MATYSYPQALLTYEMRLWSPYRLHGEAEGAAVFGDAGYVVIGNRGWRAYDERGKLLREAPGSNENGPHVRDFLTCMRTRRRPTADLETVGAPSSLLCHLGNAAWRLGRTVRWQSETGDFGADTEANELLTRASYREPWRLPAVEQV